MIYFIADTHFGHKNIIEYENRHFDNVDEMDNYMIEQWNEVVNNDDIVYHLGDFALCATKKYFDIFNQLNGEKYLIRGNHDQQSKHKLIDRMGFVEVFDELIIDDKYFLSHRPDFNVTKNYINIHGHKHGLNYKDSKSQKSNKHICVSVELIDYKPISIDKIRNELILKEGLKKSF